MASAEQKFKRRVDRAIERYGDDVSYADLELILQRRAQDCREFSLANQDAPTINFPDLAGYAGESPEHPDERE
jgi:hypothetical protein